MMKTILLFTALIFVSGTVSAQELNQIRWKSANQVRQILGEPISITKPTGRHDSLRKYGIEENRR